MTRVKSSKLYKSYPKGSSLQRQGLTEQEEAENKSSGTEQERSTDPKVQNILRLQSTIGNQAVMRLLNAKNTTSPIVQRGIFDRLRGKKKTETAPTNTNIQISGPTGGQPMGATPAPKKNAISKYEFISNPQRVVAFLNWSNV